MRRFPLVLILSLLASLVAIAPAGAVGDVSDTINIRLPAGANDPARLALRLSRATFPDRGADRVLLATQEQFADALSSGTLQGTDTPLLLTSSGDLRADVENEIERLGAEEVIVLGGEAAIDADVEEQLTDADLAVTRLSGPTRVETAVAVASLAPESSTAIVSRAYPAGEDQSQAFADALSAGAWAASEGWPTLLTGTDALPATTAAAIQDSPIERVYLLGGSAAVSDTVVAELENLGVDVQRVAGATRFATAVQVANRRGFANARTADAIILVEGQAEDAWAAGFAAAAHSAANDAPILLANGPTLPAETEAFLSGNTFAVDVDEVTEPVLICAAEPEACDRARELLGLPVEATLELNEPEDGVPSRSDLTGTLDLHGETADVAIFGPCVQDGLLVIDDDGAFDIAVQATEGACPLEFEIRFANGTVQRIMRSILVAAALPLEGPVVDTETGGDAYTFVPDGADAVEVVSYAADDTFMVDEQPATIGAFEAALTVADIVTFTADTAEGTIHSLVNVDPDSITRGTVGNIDQAADTLALVEPVSGVVLRPGIVIGDRLMFVDGDQVERDVFDLHVNEGDALRVTSASILLTNADVTGPARAITADAVSGILRFAIGGLGDDPANAEDDRYRLVEGAEDHTYTVDDNTADFADLLEALSVGDTVTYRRVAGAVRVIVDNQALPPVAGRVTETSNPDGSPVAPEPEDGGSVTVLTPTGRVSVSYSADAVFRIDGELATEPEFEAARTPGDSVTYQAPDDATGTVEEVSLDSADLGGDLADITEGANTLDVVTLAGVLYDDLDYTAAVFGGEDLYFVDGDEVDLRGFEDLLSLIDDGERLATIVVRAAGGNTEHRLTSVEE